MNGIFGRMKLGGLLVGTGLVLVASSLSGCSLFEETRTKPAQMRPIGKANQNNLSDGFANSNPANGSKGAGSQAGKTNPNATVGLGGTSNATGSTGTTRQLPPPEGTGRIGMPTSNGMGMNNNPSNPAFSPSAPTGGNVVPAGGTRQPNMVPPPPPSSTQTSSILPARADGTSGSTPIATSANNGMPPLDPVPSSASLAPPTRILPSQAPPTVSTAGNDPYFGMPSPPPLSTNSSGSPATAPNRALPLPPTK